MRSPTGTPTLSFDCGFRPIFFHRQIDCAQEHIRLLFQQTRTEGRCSEFGDPDLFPLIAVFGEELFECLELGGNSGTGIRSPAVWMRGDRIEVIFAAVQVDVAQKVDVPAAEAADDDSRFRIDFFDLFKGDLQQ